MTGKGSFVARKNVEFIREEQLRKVEACLQEAADLAKAGGISLEEVTEILCLLYKGDS